MVYLSEKSPRQHLPHKLTLIISFLQAVIVQLQMVRSIINCSQRNIYQTSRCLKITQNISFEFWHFPPIFVQLNLTCLVALFDRKLQVFQNSPIWTIFGLFDELLFTQNVNVARFARNVEWDFFCDFQTPWSDFLLDRIWCAPCSRMRRFSRKLQPEWSTFLVCPSWPFSSSCIFCTRTNHPYISMRWIAWIWSN